MLFDWYRVVLATGTRYNVISYTIWHICFISIIIVHFVYEKRQWFTFFWFLTWHNDLLYIHGTKVLASAHGH